MKKLLLLLGCLSLAGCLDVSSPVNNPSDPATETFASSLGVNISEMQKVPVGNEFVYYKDLSVGTGATLSTITQTTTVTVDYAGFLKDGSRFDARQGATFALAGTVPGFQVGMVGMNVGGERLIVIPSDLGFGPYAQPGIPANSTIVFDVILDNF